MKLEHYLTAVSAAVEAHEARMSAAFEDYKGFVSNPEVVARDGRAVLDAAFQSALAASFLVMHDTLTNLRKWPIQ